MQNVSQNSDNLSKLVLNIARDELKPSKNDLNQPKTIQNDLALSKTTKNNQCKHLID